MNSIKRQPTRVSKACDRCRRQKQRCDFFRPCSLCRRMNVLCTANGNDPKTRTKRRKVSPASGDQVTSSIKSANVSATGTDVKTEKASSLCCSDPRPSDIAGGSASQVEAAADLVDEGGIWHSRDKTLRRGPRLGATLWNTKSTLFDLGYADSAVCISKKILELRNGPTSPRATYAIPGGDPPALQTIQSNPACLVPVRELLGFDLPDAQICDSLLGTYFSTVHWFTLVIYEPTFRARYQQITSLAYASRSDFGFLLLLLMVLALGCKYGSEPGPDILDNGVDLNRLHDLFLDKVRDQFMDIMDEESLEYVQLSTLLGSFYLYHGRPRSAFSILGAAIKTAQAMGLHRDDHLNLSDDLMEERKRVWWTLYTTDRFAAILNGRPLSINDRDCSAAMPGDTIENVRFDRLTGSEQIGLSVFLERLSQLYRIASPVLEIIYGTRILTDADAHAMLPQMVAHASHRMRDWETNLPSHLNLDKVGDLTPKASLTDKLHKLQALALQLTYDNLIIILHRILLLDQGPGGGQLGENAGNPPGRNQQGPEYRSSASQNDPDLKACLESALRLSRVQAKPELVKSAAESHLVAFLGMNLFTSSMILSLCALSDPLSDTAQEAKRGITRTLLIQKTLSQRTSLSSQSSVILEDIVQLILEREREEMLRSAQAGTQSTQGSILHQPNDNVHDNTSTIYGSEVVTTPDSFTTPLGTGAALSVDSGGQGLNDNLFNLQRIIQDSSCAQKRPADFSFGHPTTLMPTDMPCDLVSTMSADTIRAADAEPWMEDLGSTWLWPFT